MMKAQDMLPAFFSRVEKLVKRRPAASGGFDHQLRKARREIKGIEQLQGLPLFTPALKTTLEKIESNLKRAVYSKKNKKNLRKQIDKHHGE